MKKNLLFIIPLLLLIAMSVNGKETATSQNIYGIVISSNENSAVIKISDSNSLSANQNIKVHTFFERLLLGMKTSGWLYAADATITSVANNQIKIKMTSHKSVMVVNNKRVWHIKAGVKVKLEY